MEKRLVELYFDVLKEAKKDKKSKINLIDCLNIITLTLENFADKYLKIYEDPMLFEKLETFGFSLLVTYIENFADNKTKKSVKELINSTNIKIEGISSKESKKYDA